MPGWSEADETLRRRIVASAERHLAEAETSIDPRLGHEPMPLHRNDVAGLRTFILLKQASPRAMLKSRTDVAEMGAGDRRASAVYRDRQIA